MASDDTTDTDRARGKGFFGWLFSGKDVPSITLLFGPLIVLGIATVVVWGGPSWPLTLTVALACTLAGAVVGFLFGVPRTVDGETPAGAPPGEAAPRQRTNTNLEQISDWLTKILLGAGLVQLEELVAGVGTLAGRIAADLPAGRASASFAAALIVLFLALGFLWSYLLTRIYVTGAFARADAALLVSTAQREARTAQKDAQKARQVVVASLNRQRRPAAEAAGGETFGKTGDDAELPRPQLLQDPNKGRFGGVPRAHGRELTARVEPVDDNPDWFLLHLECRSTDPQRPLTAPVVFHLPPTFEQREVASRPVAGRAILERLAWGAFTVGAVADDGATRLELDLSELPEAPETFRER